ncbi:hypothetical protein BGZ50_009658 [Haplosporangium sp. Z 11]|nr:hypothetical protein BGZ50_009658 [Haplosporangium sp. Z 11]
MPESHIEQLRSLGLESRSDHVEHLQEELARKYADYEDVITKQNYFVLIYLSMIESDGPSEAILTAIKKAQREDDYKNLFLTVNEADSILYTPQQGLPPSWQGL